MGRSMGRPPALLKALAGIETITSELPAQSNGGELTVR